MVQDRNMLLITTTSVCLSAAIPAFATGASTR